MEHRTSVTVRQTADVRQLVDDAGCQEEVAPGFTGSVVQRHVEAVRRPQRRPDADRAALHLVGREFPASEIAEIARCDTVARQVPVQGARSAISRLAEIAHEHPPPAPAQHERRAQPGGSASSDDDIEHEALAVQEP